MTVVFYCYVTFNSYCDLLCLFFFTSLSVLFLPIRADTTEFSWPMVVYRYLFHHILFFLLLLLSSLSLVFFNTICLCTSREPFSNVQHCDYLVVIICFLLSCQPYVSHMVMLTCTSYSLSQTLQSLLNSISPFLKAQKKTKTRHIGPTTLIDGWNKTKLRFYTPTALINWLLSIRVCTLFMPIALSFVTINGEIKTSGKYKF